MYVALQLPVWWKSLYLRKKSLPCTIFLPCTYINFQAMGHPTLVFRPARNEFSNNVPPYTCVCPTTCIWQFRVQDPVQPFKQMVSEYHAVDILFSHFAARQCGIMPCCAVADSVWMHLNFCLSDWCQSPVQCDAVIMWSIFSKRVQDINKRHPIARPSGRGMGCLLWVQPLIDILLHFPAMMCAIPCHIGPCYNGTWLFSGHVWVIGTEHPNLISVRCLF